MSVSWLPSTLAEIADLAGFEAAMALAEAVGGEKRYFPTPDRLSADHWLVMACGMEAARLIAQRFGGDNVIIPRGPTGSAARVARRIRDMIAEGASSNEITRVTGVAFRTVTRHRARVRGAENDPDDGQGILL